MKRIDVTCAIIVANGCFLACKRGMNSSHPNEWEFPGGKIEPNETARACIIREIKEELDVEVSIIEELESVEYQYSSNNIRLIPFHCEISKGQPKLIEHIEMCWQNISDFSDLKWSKADALMFDLNKTYFK